MQLRYIFIYIILLVIRHTFIVKYVCLCSILSFEWRLFNGSRHRSVIMRVFPHPTTSFSNFCDQSNPPTHCRGGSKLDITQMFVIENSTPKILICMDGFAVRVSAVVGRPFGNQVHHAAVIRDVKLDVFPTSLKPARCKNQDMAAVPCVKIIWTEICRSEKIRGKSG